MALWGKTDQANNAPKFRVTATSNAYMNAAFANTTTSAFQAGQRIGVYGANTAEAKSVGRGVAPGWVEKIEGTGPVISFDIPAAGSGYLNTDTVRVTGGTTNAAASIKTAANGAITTLTVTVPGAGFVNVSNTSVSILAANGAASAGSGANVVPVLGGRAGRVMIEQMVAMSGAGGGTTGNGSTLS